VSCWIDAADQKLIVSGGPAAAPGGFSYCMAAPTMSLELHDRGIHALRGVAGDVEVPEVRFSDRRRRGSNPARSV
jgi:hypothetical protein